MKKIKINKKARMIPEWAVSLIVLFITMFVLLFYLGEVSDVRAAKIKACHEQILYRHTFNLGPVEIGRESIPLSACKAGHICFVTENNEECEELKGLADIENVKAATKEEVIEVIANRMADCWGMVGEGHLNYQPSTWGWEHSYCGICDKIAFSDNFKERVEKIGYEEFYDYLESTPVPGLERTFSQYLYGLNSLASVEEAMLERERTSRPLADVKMSDLKMIDTSYGHAIIVGLTREGLLKKALSLEIGGIPVSASSIVIKLFAKGEDVKQIPPVVIVYDVEYRYLINSLGCDSFNFLP